MKGIKVSGPWEVVLVAAVCICAFFINNQVITPDIMESRNIIARARWCTTATGSHPP